MVTPVSSPLTVHEIGVSVSSSTWSAVNWKAKAPSVMSSGIGSLKRIVNVPSPLSVIDSTALLVGSAPGSVMFPGIETTISEPSMSSAAS